MYDIREYLNPKRLTIAMWDTAYMIRRNESDPFKNWEKALDDLKERGFNTIRIDAFPGIIDPDFPDMQYTWPKLNQPNIPWMWFNKYTCKPARDLIEFISLTRKKGLNLTLSSWWSNSRAIPSSTIEAAEMWINLLNFIKSEVGLENIIFVDLCNEIPGFLPGYLDKLKNIARPENGNNQSNEVYLSPVPGSIWTSAQLDFLKNTLDNSLSMLQRQFPEMKFTYSMNINPSFEHIGLNNIDVLDIHFFLADSRFDARTCFAEYIKTAYVTSDNYKDFYNRAVKAIDSVGPMLRQKQRQQMAWAKGFAEKTGAPLVTTEAWASWFYTDHPDLKWGWILDWCENAIDDAIEFGLWGITTNNYAEPHFELWKNIDWHRKVNDKFLNS